MLSLLILLSTSRSASASASIGLCFSGGDGEIAEQFRRYAQLEGLSIGFISAAGCLGVDSFPSSPVRVNRVFNRFARDYSLRVRRSEGVTLCIDHKRWRRIQLKDGKPIYAPTASLGQPSILARAWSQLSNSGFVGDAVECKFAISPWIGVDMRKVSIVEIAIRNHGANRFRRESVAVP
jgi:hypothetical protein